MFGSCQEALSDAREWSGGPPRYPGVVESPYRMSGSGWETLPDVQECTEGYPGCPGGPFRCPGVFERLS